ncbi:ferrous iron permease EfeU [Paenibacillus marchantiophytorum]|uniref:Ferrous iron permease EfeU n=1 Tax=Paenibacillus marchantiophytorum TaxID=1619310 RepID=A0ABQ1EWX7_9BACL|nr:FTR1 family protein [Paenibacillus marchantiophytorum]GFZ90164.1 ferrous iron permease EfeU [Paenibacillus marchantiophytorum]
MRKVFMASWIALVMFMAIPFTANAAAENDLAKADEGIVSAIQAAESGKLEDASQLFDTFQMNWLTYEEGIKQRSLAAYQKIEQAMGEVSFQALKQPVDAAKLVAGLKVLHNLNQNFIDGKLDAFGKVAKSDGNVTVASLLTLLENASNQLKQNDMAGAAESIQTLRNSWLQIEGIVLTQSSTVYTSMERDMVTAYAQLSAGPAQASDAATTIARMHANLGPLAAKTSYSMLDATTILLREGLEALLVVIALLGFLTKSGHADKKKWIWYGVIGGLVVSIALGIVVQQLFSATAFGNNNFLIAGCTGIFAAVMLLYMSYWLHSKSNISNWQQYIRDQSVKALATGSLASLSVLAFLAVFREGTETVLFMIGMASSISLKSLVGGIAIGVAILVIVSLLILKIGLKIPMRPFFLVSSFFVFYLCFKFAGMGVHGLQLAGYLPATTASWLPSWDLVALYPTLESAIPQFVLLLAAIFAVLRDRYKTIQFRNTALNK